MDIAVMMYPNLELYSYPGNGMGFFNLATHFLLC